MKGEEFVFGKRIDFIQILFHLKTKIMNPQRNTQHQEGEVTKQIENQTAKLPSDVFLIFFLENRHV